MALIRAMVGVGSTCSSHFQIKMISAVLLGIHLSAFVHLFSIGTDRDSPRELQPCPWMLP